MYYDKGSRDMEGETKMIIGIDVGGTHTDGILIKAGEIVKISKVPTRHSDLTESILKVLDQLLAAQPKNKLKRLVFSTTLTTNLIAQKKHPPTGLVLIPGPGLNSDWLKIADHNWILSGSIDHRGRRVANLELAELTPVIEEIKRSELTDLAVVSKFSPRNPELEAEVSSKLQEDLSPRSLNIQVGNQVAPVLNFPRRVQTTWLNTAVYREYKNFLHHVQNAIVERNIQAALFLLKADGGTMPLVTGVNFGVETIKSGPAASIMGILALTPRTTEPTLVLDVGGTTTDLALMVLGAPIFEPEGVLVDDYQTSVRGLLSRSLPFGGDSLVTLSHQNELRLTPKSLGPAAAFGGDQPTLTDALVILGHYAEGDQQRAIKSFVSTLETTDLEKIRSQANFIIEQFYQHVVKAIDQLLQELNQRPIYTIHELLKNQEIKPQNIIMIGGPAKAILPGLAKRLSLTPILPAYYTVANALGAALARPTVRTTLYADTAEKFYILSDTIGKQQITDNFTVETAKKIIWEHTQSLLQKNPNQTWDKTQFEIIYEESFPIIRNSSRRGEIFRLEAQLRPGVRPLERSSS